MNLSKSPLLGDVDLLAARELELGLAEGFNHMLLVLQLGADGHYDLANVDPGHCALGLSKGTVHTCLESISSSARQHLVDADDMEGVEPYSNVKTIFATTFHHVICWHKYRQPPGLQRRAAHTHLTPCGHRVGAHPLWPSYAPS